MGHRLHRWPEGGWFKGLSLGPSCSLGWGPWAERGLLSLTRQALKLSFVRLLPGPGPPRHPSHACQGLPFGTRLGPQPSPLDHLHSWGLNPPRGGVCPAALRGGLLSASSAGPGAATRHLVPRGPGHACSVCSVVLGDGMQETAGIGPRQALCRPPRAPSSRQRQGGGWPAGGPGDGSSCPSLQAFEHSGALPSGSFSTALPALSSLPQPRPGRLRSVGTQTGPGSFL